MNARSSLDSAMLAQLQESVARALAEATAREQALAPEKPNVPRSAARQGTQACEQRLGAFEAQADRAAEKLRDMDASVAQNETDLRRFLASAADLRHHLADWTTRAIG